MNRFLNFSKEHNSCLHKLKLSIHREENDNQSCVTRWIDIEHLDLECLLVKRHCFEVMPLSLFICERLLYSRLHRVSLRSFESVSLPCVKTMRLELNVYANEECLESLISSCTVLEDLGIVRRVDDNVKVLRVHSQTLTSLTIESQVDDDDAEFDYKNFGIIRWVDDNIKVLRVHSQTLTSLTIDTEADDVDEESKSRVIIDAPRLKHLNFVNDVSESKIISNSASLTKVNLLGDFYMRDSVRNFFTSISRVSEMNISWLAFEFIGRNTMSLPRFCNLTYLEVKLYFSSVHYLPTFLKSCPNLKSLILDLLSYSSAEQTRLSVVPHYLLLSLEFVEMKGIGFRIGTRTSKVFRRELSNPQGNCCALPKTNFCRLKGSPCIAKAI